MDYVVLNFYHGQADSLTDSCFSRMFASFLFGA